MVTSSSPPVTAANSLKRNLYSMSPSSFSRSVTSLKLSSLEMVMVTVLGSLFRASRSPAAIQPIQARRTEAPMTQATYSRTKPAVRPVEGRRLLRRGAEVRSRAPPRDPSVRWSLAS